MRKTAKHSVRKKVLLVSDLFFFKDTGAHSFSIVTSEGWYWNVARARLSNFNVHVKQPWVHAPPSPRQNVLSFNLDAHIPHSLDVQAASIFFLTLPPPTVPPCSCPFYTDFPSLSVTPHPPVQCCVLEQRTLFNYSCCRQTRPVERATAFSMSCPIPGHEIWGRTEHREVRCKNERVNIPSSDPPIPYQPSAFLSFALQPISLRSSLSLSLPACPLGEDTEETEICIISYLPPSTVWLLVHPRSMKILSLSRPSSSEKL